MTIVDKYLLVGVGISDCAGSGDILVKAGISQVGVRSLVILLVEVIGEPVLEPVTVESLRVVDVFVHI